jgi:hypothetical protein
MNLTHSDWYPYKKMKSGCTETPEMCIQTKEHMRTVRRQETKPTGTLILDLQLPEQQENKFPLLKQASLSYLIRAA